DEQKVEHQEQHAVHGVLRADHQHGEPEDARRDEIERDRLAHQSNNTFTMPVTTRLAIATGISTFHPSRISWSYRYRGSVARIQMKKYRKRNDLTRNQVQDGTTSRTLSIATLGNGRSHPPKKSVLATEETTIMVAYPARK